MDCSVDTRHWPGSMNLPAKTGCENEGRERYMRLALLMAGLFLLSFAAGAHNISDSNARFVQGLSGSAPGLFLYLGAKHMVTGYDHLLYLVGVVFFLRHFRDVLVYVTLFTLGHSITLMTGVLVNLSVNAYLIDAIIGLSVVYKAFENINGFKQIFGVQLSARLAVFVFGLFHGLGLATKVQDLSLSSDSLVTNMLNFNIGVEIGQALALVCIVALLGLWRHRVSFERHAFIANTALMSLGFMLAGYQFAGYLWA